VDFNRNGRQDLLVCGQSRLFLFRNGRDPGGEPRFRDVAGRVGLALPGVRSAWVDDFDGLLGLVAIGAIELHTWNSTIDNLEHPNLMVFDLDPGPGVSFAFVTQTAFALREMLKHEGLQSWPKLQWVGATGSPRPGTTRASFSASSRLASTLTARLSTVMSRTTTPSGISGSPPQPARATRAATAIQRHLRIDVVSAAISRGVLSRGMRRL
jgi:hypothetical protein